MFDRLFYQPYAHLPVEAQVVLRTEPVDNFLLRVLHAPSVVQRARVGHLAQGGRPRLRLALVDAPVGAAPEELAEDARNGIAQHHHILGPTVLTQSQ